MPVIRARGFAACGLGLALLGLLGCGDDDSAPGRGTKHKDAAVPRDAATDAAMDAEVEDPPSVPVKLPDAGKHDASKPVEPPPDVVPDAMTPVPPTCADLDCEAMSDDCNVVTCNPKTVKCVVKVVADDTPCGSQALTNCSAPDRCTAGVCEPRDAAEGTACGDTNADCRVDDTCDGAGTCVDKGLAAAGTPCGEQTPSDPDCDAPDTCDADGTCQPRYVAADTSCGDEDVSCRYDDKCDGFGSCQDGGLWEVGACPNGQDGSKCICGRTDQTVCHPNKDLCDDGTCVLGNDDTATCGSQTLIDPTCDRADHCAGGICSPNALPAGTVCGNQTRSHPTCDAPDSCDGGGHCATNNAGTNVVCGAAPGPCADEKTCTGTGTCSAAAPFKDSGTVCGAAPDACHETPKCSGGSNSCPAALAAPPGTACGNPVATDPNCDEADSCDGAGICNPHHQPMDTECGSQATEECSLPDSCDGSGMCNPHHVPAGTDCGDQGMACLNDDACNSSGVCVDNGYDSPCPLIGIVTADNAGVAGVTVQVLGTGGTVLATALPTAVDGSFTLNAPLGQEILLRVSPIAGYYGQIRARTFTAVDIGQSLDLSLEADASIEEPADTAGGTALTTKGAVFVAVSSGVSGINLSGHEGATLTPAADQGIASVDGGGFEYSDTIMQPSFAGALYFYNAPVTQTMAVAPVDGTANTCRRVSSFSSFPVQAHTVTWVDIVCE